MAFPTCSAFSRAARTSSVSSLTCLLAFLNCLPALPTCLARPSIPPPVPGTAMPRTFFGLFPRRVAITAPPIRPAAPVASPATTGALGIPPFCVRALPPPPPPDEEARLRDDAEEERRAEALALPLPLFALVLERGLLFEALLLFDAVPLFDAFERVLRELRADPLALDPFE